MKKFLISLSAVAVLATFTACNCNSDCDDDCGSDKNEKATVENNESGKSTEGKCGEGKCGEGKCGSEKSNEAKPDKFSIMDSNQDGSLTEIEFITFVSTQFPKKDTNSDGFLSKDECDHFDMANTNGDDKVTREEFDTALNDFFQSIDTDSNGKITKEELMAHMKAEQNRDVDIEHKCGEGKCGSDK